MANIRSIEVKPKVQKVDTIDNKQEWISPVSDARRFSVRGAQQKQAFHCQLCSERNSDRMVQCGGDGCEQWFHFDCVEVSEQVAKVTTKDSTPPSIISLSAKHRMSRIKYYNYRTFVQSERGTERPKSRASLVRRMRELELQKLNEEFERQRRFLEKKFLILKDYGSDTSKVASNLENMSNIQEWVEETEHHGD